MIHAGTLQGTNCGKPVARRWWVEWPPKPRFDRIGNLIIRDDGPATAKDAGATCPKCLAAPSPERQKKESAR